jgi:endonuclease III
MPVRDKQPRTPKKQAPVTKSTATRASEAPKRAVPRVSEEPSASTRAGGKLERLGSELKRAGKKLTRAARQLASSKVSARARKATVQPSAGAREQAKADKAKRVPAKRSPAKRGPAKRGPRADPSAVEQRLARALPTAFCELEFNTPFELLVATILAAQSTDKMINLVMPELLAVLPDVHALARAEQEQVEQLVKRSGFFRNKAKAIRGAAQQLVERHGGEVPHTLEELVALPGVARKTANVVLGTAYRIPSGFIVDTHVMRVSQRLRLTKHSDPVKIEQDLVKLFARDSWIDMGHRLTLHGRYTCVAKAPLCEVCPLNELCPSRLEEPRESWEERADAEASRVAAQTRLSRS